MLLNVLNDILYSKLKRLSQHVLEMSSYTFVQQYNPMSGAIEWTKQLEDYDYTQAIARSSYADMVNDSHRNQLYYKAINKSIAKLLSDGQRVRALDIGTGTGLLSMMTAKSGAHCVTACESFEPMAKCAKNIIDKNGLSDKINVIAKRSNELTVGTDVNDMSERANLLVAELFDTELIGEGALPTYRHAVSNLLTADALLVPSKAYIYAQLVESEKLYSYHQLNGIKINDNIAITPPEMCKQCNGSNILHDIQINQLKPNVDFIIVTKPEVIFEFEFNNLSSLKANDRKIIDFKAMRDISGPLVIIMWWDLHMDYESELILSCAPFWNQLGSTRESIPWRDHWIQSIYYFPAYNKHFTLKANDHLKVEANHDEYSLWFDLFDETKCSTSSTICNCGIHSHISRTRMALMNDAIVYKQYYDAINSIINCKFDESMNALYIGDESVLPFIIAKMNRINRVYCLPRNRHTELFINSYSNSNDCSDKIVIINDFELIDPNSVKLVFAEPYFGFSEIPWNNLHYWYLLNRLPKYILTNDFIIMPYKAIVKAIPVEFDHLWKIRADVGSDVEGFDLTLYDTLITNAIKLSDSSIESQPLWEYSGKALAEQPKDLFTFDFSKPYFDDKQHKIEVHFDITRNIKILKTKYISLAFWVEFYLFNDNYKTSTGPITPIKSGEDISWNRHYKQGVYFLPNLTQICDKYEENCEFVLKFNILFNKENGEITCALNID